jgi:HEPN domain-containing protein
MSSFKCNAKNNLAYNFLVPQIQTGAKKFQSPVRLSMKNESLARIWLKRAKSNLQIAKAGKVFEDILYEDLCFDCEQAVEKALKALLVSIDVSFPRTHSIDHLIELIEEHSIMVPDEIKDSSSLTAYAVNTRYPGTLSQ